MIRPFLTQHAAQHLVQALVISRLDYCNALLAGLPSCTIKPLQMIYNAAAQLVFSEPKKAHVTPLFISLHWLPGCSSHQVQDMLAYRTATGSAPTYFHSLMTVYISSRSLRSASERRLVVPSQRGTKLLFGTFSFTVFGWWNEQWVFRQTMVYILYYKVLFKPFQRLRFSQNWQTVVLTIHVILKWFCDELICNTLIRYMYTFFYKGKQHSTKINTSGSTTNTAIHMKVY